MPLLNPPPQNTKVAALATQWSGTMKPWDITVTAIKCAIIAILYYLTASLAFAIVCYCLLVPVPLVIVRPLLGLRRSPAPAMLLAVVGLDMFYRKQRH